MAGFLIVRRSLWRGQEGSPKGGHNRKVPLSDVALAALKAHRHLGGPHVFCDERGNHLTHSMLKDVVPRACSVAKLAKRITTHGLRHTFASHLIMRGASLKAVQELLGHESIEMTLAVLPRHTGRGARGGPVEISGDKRETLGAQKENPRGDRGLD